MNVDSLGREGIITTKFTPNMIAKFRIRILGPAYGSHETRKQSSVLECLQHCPNTGVAEWMDDQNHSIIPPVRCAEYGGKIPHKNLTEPSPRSVHAGFARRAMHILVRSLRLPAQGGGLMLRDPAVHKPVLGRRRIRGALHPE